MKPPRFLFGTDIYTDCILYKAIHRPVASSDDVRRNIFVHILFYSAWAVRLRMKASIAVRSVRASDSIASATSMRARCST